MSETETIKPCPFCGEPENIGLTGLFDTDYVLCYSCHSRGPFSKDKADAVLLWNAAANALDAARAERDEARAWARRLWRESHPETTTCPACKGLSSICPDCRGTGRSID